MTSGHLQGFRGQRTHPTAREASSYERSELASALAGLRKDGKEPALMSRVNNQFVDNLVKGEIENFGSHFQDGPYADGSMGVEKARW